MLEAINFPTIDDLKINSEGIEKLLINLQRDQGLHPNYGSTMVEPI